MSRVSLDICRARGGTGHSRKAFKICINFEFRSLALKCQCACRVWILVKLPSLARSKCERRWHTEFLWPTTAALLCTVNGTADAWSKLSVTHCGISMVARPNCVITSMGVQGLYSTNLGSCTSTLCSRLVMPGTMRHSTGDRAPSTYSSPIMIRRKRFDSCKCQGMPRVDGRDKGRCIPTSEHDPTAAFSRRFICLKLSSLPE